MSRYRVWPAMLLALVGCVSAAAVVLDDAAVPPDGGCAHGLDWAAVTAVPDWMTADEALLVDYRQQFQPILIGCLDLEDLTPAKVPDPRS